METTANNELLTLTKQRLKKLKKSLPSNGLQDICENFHFTRRYLDKIFSAEVERIDVISYALELAQKEKERIHAISEQISKL